MADKTRTEDLLQKAVAALTVTGAFQNREELLLGVDLGTASIVMVVLNGQKNPIACELELASVVRDGLLVDYFGAVTILQRLKERLEARLGVPLTRAAIAVPPGTNSGDAGAHRHVVEACGLEVTGIVDEPTAANRVLGVQNGVVVDIGGGTTGLTVFRDGDAVYTADEATGGVHVSLVLMGSLKISFEEAEALKRDPARSSEVLGMVKPVIEKMAGIVRNHIRDYQVDNICLVGGTCCLGGMENIFKNELGITAYKPPDPFLVTPVGIAMSCG